MSNTPFQFNDFSLIEWVSVKCLLQVLAFCM